VIGRWLVSIGLCAALVGVWLLGHRAGRSASSAAAPQQAQASTGRLPAPAARLHAKGQGPSPAASASRSPAETARLLQTLHQQRDYAAIAPLIVADRRDAQLDLLMTIDDVLSANEDLQVAVRKAYGGAVTGLWDLAAMENNLGPFSARVAIINQSFKGNTATVTFQEGENVPLARALFDWAEDRWQYRPEATPAQLLPELGRLARILRDVTKAAGNGTSFDDCFNIFAQRVFPQMHRIVTAGDDRPETVATGQPADSAD
jgi:hypothetical protein